MSNSMIWYLVLWVIFFCTIIIGLNSGDKGLNSGDQGLNSGDQDSALGPSAFEVTSLSFLLIHKTCFFDMKRGSFDSC